MNKKNKLDYKKSNKDVRSAWFSYKKQNKSKSTVDFVAGWNAAMQHLTEKEKNE